MTIASMDEIWYNFATKEMKVKNKAYRERVADKLLFDYLKSFGAVCVEGPKWCGKTWLAQHQAASACMIADPTDNFATRGRVDLDINYAFRGDRPHLIDEWQEFPSLWDATRYHVDQNAEPGQYILTGSSVPKVKGVMHSGTGRIASLRLRTMSLWESGNSEGSVSLGDLCDGKDIGIVPVRRPELQEIVELILRGGWPGTLGMPFKYAVKTPAEYVRQIIEKDIHRLDNVRRDQHKVELLMRSLARNEATVVGIRTLVSDIATADGVEIADDTIALYLDALTRLFVIENQQPFAASLRSGMRLRKAEKRHFCDPSLAAALLKATPEKLERDLRTLGFLFEGLVERDLRTYAEALGGELSHYQDYGNHEIDAVVELSDGRWVGIEVKLGVNQEESAAEGLKKIAAQMSAGGNAPSALLVVVGLASAAYRRKDGVYVVPITALRP